MTDTSATIGCVSFLNSRPLIAGLETANGIRLAPDVPSRLLDGLLEGRTAIALCPVIDFQTSQRELCIVPVGAIGSDGETLTVRVFARRPLHEVSVVAVDGDSRTSVALLQLVLRELYGAAPALEPLAPGASPIAVPDGADGVLLIGDKVVTSAPELPFQLDLGEAWKRITGLPFVFAAWMSLQGRDLGELPELLRARRDANLRRIETIVAEHAGAAGWPPELAQHYLGTLLRYELGQRQLKAVTTFWKMCLDAGLIRSLRPLAIYGEQRPLS